MVLDIALGIVLGYLGKCIVKAVATVIFSKAQKLI